MSIYVIVTALVQMPLVKGAMECNLSGRSGTKQCFGLPGEPLIFHLPTNVTGLFLKKDAKYSIFSTGYERPVNLHADYVNNSEFSPNGTFKLNKVQKARDSGDYQLQTFGSDGTLLYNITMHLVIKAPVSKPVLSQVCLSPERMNISCCAKGEDAQLIFTLDTYSLMQTRDHCQPQGNSTADTLSLAGSTDNQHESSVSNVTISLHGQLTGKLTCCVHNSVSREETVIQLTSCKGFSALSSPATLAAIASTATLLLHVALFLCMKFFKKKMKPVPVIEGNSEDDIVYSVVQVTKNTKKTRHNLHLNATSFSPEM